VDKAASGNSLSASSNDHTATSNCFTITVAEASQIVFSQQPTNATAGQAISSAVTVQVQDPYGNRVTTYNSTAILTLSSGVFEGGSNTAQAPVSSGVATFNNLKIDTAGTYTLLATNGSLTGATSQSFTIMATVPSTLTFSTQPPASIQAGAAFGTVVQVKDKYGNNVSGANVTLALKSNPGRGTLHPTTPTQTTDSNGQATFNDLWLGKAGSGYRLSASCNGHTATSAAFTITPGTASTIAFTTQPPANTSAGAAFTTVVRVQDEYGNNVSGVSVTLALGANPTGGTLHGTLTRITAKTGLASFTNLWVDRAGKRYCVTAAVATVGIVATSRFLNFTPSPVGLIATATPTFTWFNVAGADHYTLVVVDLTTNRRLVQIFDVKNTFWALTGAPSLKRGHIYGWYVWAYGSNGSFLARSPTYVFRYY
jgi:adhesin/invasin